MYSIPIIMAFNLQCTQSINTCNRLILILQTGNESSVDRLMKQIASFMSEISDEFKTVVVEAIQSVCIKFPRKHHVLMNFLANMLREEVFCLCFCLPSIHLPVCLPVCLSVCLSICLSAHLSISLSAHLSVCLSVCPSIIYSIGRF